MSSFLVVKERSAAAGMPSMNNSNADADATSRKQKQQQRILTSVHFDSCVQGILVPSLEDMSPDGIQRRWHGVSTYTWFSHWNYRFRRSIVLFAPILHQRPSSIASVLTKNMPIFLSTPSPLCILFSAKSTPRSPKI